MRSHRTRNAGAISLIRVVNEHSVQVVPGSTVQDTCVRRYLYLSRRARTWSVQGDLQSDLFRPRVG